MLRDLVQGRNGNEFKVHSKTSYQYGRLEQNSSRRPWKLYKTYPSDLAYCLRAQWSMWKRRGEGCKSLRWWVIPQKPHFADTTGLVQIWTLRECDSIHKTCTSSNQINSSMEIKKSTPSLTPKNIFAIDNYWEMDNQGFLHSGVTTTLQGMLRNCWSIRSRLHGLFGWVIFLFCVLFLFVFFVYVCVCIFVSFLERKNTNFGDW